MTKVYLIKNGEIKEDSDSDLRGRPIKCQKCKVSFRFESDNEKEDWSDNELECPFCGELRCNKPKIERQLFYLQDEYLETFKKEPDNLIVLDQKKKHKIETEFYNLLSKYVKNLLLKYFKSQVKDDENIDYYIHSSVVKLLEKYYRTDKERWLDFKIEDSFGGMFVTKGRRGLIAEAMFEKAEVMECDISLDYCFEDNNPIEYEDLGKSYLDSINDNLNIQDIISFIVELTLHVGKYCNSKEENIRRLNGLSLYYKEGENAFDRYYRKNGNLGKSMAQQTLYIIRKEVNYAMDHYYSSKVCAVEQKEDESLTKLEIQRRWMKFDKNKYNSRELRNKWYKEVDYKRLDEVSKRNANEFLDDYLLST